MSNSTRTNDRRRQHPLPFSSQIKRTSAANGCVRANMNSPIDICYFAAPLSLAASNCHSHRKHPQLVKRWRTWIGHIGLLGRLLTESMVEGFHDPRQVPKLIGQVAIAAGAGGGLPPRTLGVATGSPTVALPRRTSPRGQRSHVQQSATVCSSGVADQTIFRQPGAPATAAQLFSCANSVMNNCGGNMRTAGASSPIDSAAPATKSLQLWKIRLKT